MELGTQLFQIIIGKNVFIGNFCVNLICGPELRQCKTVCGG